MFIDHLGPEHTYASRKPHQEAGSNQFHEMFREAANKPPERVADPESDTEAPVETFTPTQVSSWCKLQGFLVIFLQDCRSRHCLRLLVKN